MFWDVHHPEEAVILSLDHETYDELVIEVENPQGFLPRALDPAQRAGPVKSLGRIWAAVRRGGAGERIGSSRHPPARDVPGAGPEEASQGRREGRRGARKADFRQISGTDGSVSLISGKSRDIPPDKLTFRQIRRPGRPVSLPSGR